MNTKLLQFLVFIDYFSVSLVVPLLHQYYVNAGIKNANQREILSSLYSSSQIIGGITLGILSDIKLLSRKNILLLSFIGSSISYGLISASNIYMLLFSRVLVGFVKQTMTMIIAMVSKNTKVENRTSQIGRINASSRTGWVLGSSCGAFLFKHVGKFSPVILASFLFSLNFVVALKFLEEEKDTNHSTDIKPDIKGNSGRKDKGSERLTKYYSFLTNLKSCFSSKNLSSVVTSLLLLSWVGRATSYASIASFYEITYGITQRGYLSSYTSILALIVEGSFIKKLLDFFGGERRASYISAGCLFIISLMESLLSISDRVSKESALVIFLVFLLPAFSTFFSLLNLSLQSLVTQMAPEKSLGSVLAALDVLRNGVMVTVPFYRTLLFKITEMSTEKSRSQGNTSIMRGDPDPSKWLVASAVHWAITSVILYYLLNQYQQTQIEKQDVHKKNERKTE